MALQRTPIPEVEVLSDGSRVRLTWPGGRHSEHTAYDLRVLCPCALCVDEMTGVRTLDPEQVDGGVTVSGLERVGRYALRIRFSDGHSTGLYPYRMLADLGSRDGD